LYKADWYAVGRETDEEREARLKDGGAWLDAELKKRSWSQRYLSEQLGVSQQQVSLYVRGRYEIDGKLARDLARALELPQRDVWRGMRLVLPEEFETDEALDDYYEAKYPDVFAAVEKRTGVKVTGSGGKHRRAGVRRKAVTRKSDDEGRSGQDRASGA